MSLAQPKDAVALPPTDAELLARWRTGDTRALDQLLRRYQRPLFGLFFRSTNNRSEAEDLTQRVFLRALDKLPRLRDDAAFKGWLFSIAINLNRNRFRTLVRWRPTKALHTDPAVEEHEDPSPSAEEQLRLKGQRTALRQAIQQLPRMQRESARLRLYAELSFREIGLVLGTSESSAKVSFHHAVQKLRSNLAFDPPAKKIAADLGLAPKALLD